MSFVRIIIKKVRCASRIDKDYVSVSWVLTKMDEMYLTAGALDCICNR